MVTIRNKFLLLAAGFWLAGLVLVLLGASGKHLGWASTGLLLTLGMTSQAMGLVCSAT